MSALAAFLLAIDFTSVSIALPALAQSLQAELVTLQWVITAPQMLNGSLLILGGRLADLYGPRRCFLSASCAYVAGALIALLSPGLYGMILGRAINGSSMAVSGPALLTLLGNTLPAGRPLNRALAVYGAFANIGAAVGVFVGGVCITHFGARGAFVLNLVFGLANLLAGLMLLPPTVHRVTSQRQLNIPSAMLASLACGLVIFTMTTARRSGVTAPDTLISALLSLGAILAFLRVEAKIRTPLIPVNLLKIPALMTAMLALGFGSAASIGMYVAVGGYLQGVVHFSAQEVGFLFLPSAITATLAGYLVPAVLRRTGPRRGMAAGYAATGFAFIIFTMLKYGMVVPLTIVAMVTHGCGGVLGFTAGLGEVSNVVTPSERGVASALMLTSLSIFASLGGALYGVVLQPQQLGASAKFQNGFWLAVALNLVATTFASYQPKPSKTSCLPG